MKMILQTADRLDTETVDQLFPLPLTVFERYMVADDRVGYPMTFGIVVELDGRIERSVFESAVVAALVRHPMFCAILRSAGRQTCWIAAQADDFSNNIRWLDDQQQTPTSFHNPIEISKSCGWRIEVVDGGDQVTLRFHFHHAISDGIGAIQFIGDVLASYGIETTVSGSPPKLRKIDNAGLINRGRFDIRVPGPVTRWQAIRSMIGESFRTLAQRPQPLVAGRRSARDVESSADDLPVEGLPVVTIPREWVERLQQTAAAAGVTTNDLLLRDMFLTVRRWNESRRKALSRSWIRLTIPTSLRGRRDLRLSAANVIGYALIGRRESSCDESPDFLNKLASDTLVTRQWGLGSFFVKAVRLVDFVPGLLHWITWASRSFSTAVFSNLGDPFRRMHATFPRSDDFPVAGNLIVRRMYGAPPVRPGTKIALAALQVAGELNIALRYDPRFLTDQDGRDFLTMLSERIKQTVISANK